MADDSTVIRDFLVRLGFQVNESGNKKFDNALNKTAKTAGAAGKTLLGVGLAAQAMVAAYTSSMEKLYYASRRTGASVSNIQALEFGAQKIGIAAGEAQGALEGMAAAVRSNPGLRGLMDQLLGKDSSQMDQAKAMIELVQRLSSMPHYVGSQFAGMFGINEKTFLMLKQGLPELLKAEEERLAMNKRAGLNAEDAAKASVVYANSIRDLTTRIGVLVGRLSIELLPAFQRFNELAVETIDHIQGMDFKNLNLGPVSKEVGELNKAFETLVKTWTMLSKTEEAGNFFSNIKNSALDASKGIIEMIAGLAYLASGEWKKGGSLVWSGLKGQVKGSVPATAARGAFDWINAWRDSGRGKNEPDSAYNGESPSEAAARRARGQVAPPSAAAGGTRGIRNNNPGNIEFRGQPGATSDGRFARFANASYGLEAMAAQLDLYNQRGLNTIAKVVSKWAPKDENDTAAYIAAVSKRMGVDPGAKLNLKDANVLSSLMGAMITQENGRNPYNEFQMLGAAQNRVGDGGVTINQNTEIHVAPGSSAAATGAEVGRVQGRVNGDMVRNFTGAVR